MIIEFKIADGCKFTENVADVTETRNVIPSLEFKTCMTIKS